MSLPPTDPEMDLISPDNPDPPSEHPQLVVRSFGMTDRGRTRPSNEDQFLIAELTKALRIRQTSLPQAWIKYADEQGHLFLVADGIGGAPAGEQASALVVKSVEEFLVNTLKWFFQLKGVEEEKVVLEFQDALRRADAKIFREVELHPELEGMGTTLTLAYSLGANVFVANAGDSRCYLFRRGELLQLTRDHTLVQDLIQQGMPPLAPSERLVGGHWITNAIGGNGLGVKVDVHKLTLEPGDVLLLATDGLTNELTDQRIASVLAAESDPEIACNHLMAETLEHGGHDNVTVIIARYETATD